jgi:hypothetical protein
VAVWPSLAFAATNEWVTADAAIGLPAARSVPSGAGPGTPNTSNSASCAAGHPVLAVTVIRTQRAWAAVKPMVAVGLKTCPADGDRVRNAVPSVDPVTVSVWVREPQSAVGSLRTTWSTVVVAPRSTWIHCGNALPALSQ